VTLILQQDGQFISASVAVNGRARCAVTLSRRGTDETLLIDEANIVNRKERQELVSYLDKSLYRDAFAVLEKLAIRVQHAREDGIPDKPAPTEEGVFPSVVPWEDAVDGEVLLDDVCTLLRQYVVLPEHADVAIALWLVHTHVTDVADYTPYLLVTSPVRECGKTTLLELLLHLAYRAQMTGGITAAGLYRRIHRLSPTMLLDELDGRLRGDGGELLRCVLNTGFQRGGKFTICVGDEHEDKDFNTFCPKVLSGIGRVWDTVTSRSIPIRLARASKDELATLRKMRGDTIAGICLPYQRRIRRWAADVTDTLRQADVVTPNELGARQCDVWRPLLAIADAVSVTWGEKARAAALALHGLAEEEGDYGLLMLQDVHGAFAARNYPDAMFTSTILEVLCAREDRPWPEYRHDRPITPRGVANLLGRFGVKPGSVRVGDATGKGYKLEALTPVFRTYLIPLNLSVTSVTNGADGAAVTDVTDRNQGVRGDTRYALDERAGLEAGF
jgi:hypothetical protein